MLVTDFSGTGVYTAQSIPWFAGLHLVSQHILQRGGDFSFGGDASHDVKESEPQLESDCALVNLHWRPPDFQFTEPRLVIVITRHGLSEMAGDTFRGFG